jgi:hypothetical protein
LETFLEQRVIDLGDEEKLKQKPELPLNAKIVLHQVDLNKIKRLKVHIIAPARLTTGDLIVLDGTDDEEIARCKVEEAREAHPWEIDLLPVTRYTVAHSDSDDNKTLDPAKATGDPYVFRL